MHIHPNNTLQLASLGPAREEANAIQAKRAAEVRRKLSAVGASRVLQASEDEIYGAAGRVAARSYGRGEQPGGDDFGRLFSAEA